jgi:glycosyltransferase involved in cell wall biosynthesis
MRLAIATSHPIQYYAPLFRELARRLDTHVFYAHHASPEQQAAAGFGSTFDWDIDLASGYESSYLTNVAARPGTDHFRGCDTPEIGTRLSEGRFDALLVFGWGLKSSVQAVWAAKRLRMPVMVRGDSQLQTPRSAVKRWGKELLYPRLLRVFDAALYVGERSRAYYEHYRYPAERLFFSPHCVDNAWFAQRATAQARATLRTALGIGDEDRVVLFAGKLQPFKRADDVVEVSAILARQGLPVRVMVAGSGEAADSLRAHAAALGVQLHLLGFQNQSQMPAAYAAADALMLPSEHETWGLVCNEALACSRPIVVSDAVGCAEDLARDGAVGMVFPTGDVDQAAVGLRRMLTAPPSAGAFANRCRDYSLAAAAAGVVTALESLDHRCRI